MAGNSRDEETKPCISERYATAVGTSNMRVAEHGSAVADVVAAAGMNKHRTGLSLRRLLFEWDKSAKPKRLTDEQIEALAKAQKPEPAELRFAVQMTEEQRSEAIAKHGLDPRNFVSVAVVEAPNPRVGLVKYQDGERTVYLRPSEAAERDADRWYSNDLAILLQSLPTLPSIRDALLVHVREQGWEGDIHLVTQVLLWWLDSRCDVCEGRRNRIIPGTGRTGAKPCGACHGTGVKRTPYGWQGAKMLAHIKGCLTHAAQDLSEGTFKHQRSVKNQTARELEELRVSGKPILKLPPKVPPRRYSPAGKFYDGEYVSRGGGDVHLVTEMDEQGDTAAFVCVVAPQDGWCKVGDRELNLCRRYMRVEYDPKKET